jgi:thioredoxin reductase
MPEGMHLKSDGFASDLYDPERRSTLKQYCLDHQIEYSDYGLPVRLDTFVSYALDFQAKLVPMLEPVCVEQIGLKSEGYRLRLENGETVGARAVVMATGISYFGFVPEPLAGLPAGLCSHSSAHHDLSGFRDRRVVVIGGGASATDLAALLHRKGASVQIVTRRPLEFHLPPSDKPRSLWQRLRAPNLGLGPGLKSAFYTAFPGLFHLLPRHLRLSIVDRHLGPAGGWFIKDQVIGTVPVHVGFTVQSATPINGAVALRLSDGHGKSLDIEADHIIAATGYLPSLSSLTILDKELRDRLQIEAQGPVLSRVFEASTAGLYFIGVASANSFGPVMRFVRGAEYASTRLAAHLGTLYGHRPAGGTSNSANV